MKLATHIVDKVASQNSVSNADAEVIYKGLMLIDDSYILISQLDQISPVFINVQYDLLEGVMKSSGICFLLYNVEPQKRPDALSRRVLINRLIKIRNSIKYFALGNCTELINRNAMHYMFGSAEIVNYSIHQTEEEAIKKLKEVIKNESQNR